ncbi:MAG: type II toxin-antitoxin system RelE/ParE family toxin [Candidatus Hydrothermarchaeales archaeon]
MPYRVLIDREALAFAHNMPEKSQRIVKDNLKKLVETPYPGSGGGDKEKLTYRGDSLYRMHIARAFTAFYRIYDDDKTVKVLKVMTIERAHKEYGKL